MSPSSNDFVSSFIDLLADAIAQRLSGNAGSAGGEPGRRGPGRPPGSGARRKGGRRSSEELEQMTTELFTHIQNNPGMRMEQIASALQLTTKDLVLPAQKLLSTKRVKTKGVKRATKYFAA